MYKLLTQPLSMKRVTPNNKRAPKMILKITNGAMELCADQPTYLLKYVELVTVVVLISNQYTEGRRHIRFKFYYLLAH